jgi:hypothetical protein
MKHIPSMVLAVIILCFPALKAQAQFTPTNDDAIFLKSCGLSQTDIIAIPNLTEDGQANLQMALGSNLKKCTNPVIKAFKATRDFLRVFTPPPPQCPMPPNEYDSNYLTPDELAYVNSTNKSIMDKILGWFTGK